MHISKLLWAEWVAYLFFSANFTLISEKWLWPLEYPFNYPPRGALIRLIFEQFSLFKSNIKVYFLFHFYVLANTKTIIPLSVGA